jgi:hypothetical protein
MSSAEMPTVLVDSVRAEDQGGVIAFALEMVDVAACTPDRYLTENAGSPRNDGPCSQDAAAVG